MFHKEKLTKLSLKTKSIHKKTVIKKVLFLVRWSCMGVVQWLYIFLHLSLCIKNDHNALQFFRNYLLEFFQKLNIFSFRNVPETQGTNRRWKKGRKKRCYALISYYFLSYAFCHINKYYRKKQKKITKIANSLGRKSYNND